MKKPPGRVVILDWARPAASGLLALVDGQSDTYRSVAWVGQAAPLPAFSPSKKRELSEFSEASAV
jgi:hypothetical protein